LTPFRQQFHEVRSAWPWKWRQFDLRDLGIYLPVEWHNIPECLYLHCLIIHCLNSPRHLAVMLQLLSSLSLSTEMQVKNSVLWHVTSCNLVEVYDDSDKPLHSHHRGNLKSHQEILLHSVIWCSSRFCCNNRLYNLSLINGLLDPMQFLFLNNGITTCCHYLSVLTEWWSYKSPYVANVHTHYVECIYLLLKQRR